MITVMHDDDTDAMIDAAFKALADRHPEAKSGDMDPMVLCDLRRAMEQFGQHWLDANMPPPLRVRYESEGADDWEGEFDQWCVDNDLPDVEQGRLKARLERDGRAEDGDGTHVFYSLTVIP